MRVITLNVNGIRAAERKGLARWLARVEPWDVVCLQEFKAHHDDVPKSPARAAQMHVALPSGARRKGYAGVGVYARAPAAFATGFGSREFDREGRYLEADFRDLTVISLYLPSGSSGPAPAGVEIPLPRRVPAASCASCARRSARSSCAATGTSRTRTST